MIDYSGQSPSITATQATRATDLSMLKPLTFAITQISTSVQQTTEVVLLKPAVLTLREASRVPVIQDTPEMDLHAQVTVLEQ